ncbi:MAG: hypothetical protein C7N36_15965, partial [Bacteroidetes bacterium]
SLKGKSLPRFLAWAGDGFQKRYAATISVKHKSTPTLKSVASSFAASRCCAASLREPTLEENAVDYIIYFQIRQPWGPTLKA